MAVVPFPQHRRLALPDLARLAPSGRSLLAGFAFVGLAALTYLGARETSVFAIRAVDVRGAPPATAAEVRSALGPLRGESLLALSAGDVERRLAALPDVASASYDRAFPHTLRIVVVPERPVAVLRRGAGSWLVSTRGRILRPVGHGARRALPRIWVAAGADLPVGATLAPDSGARAAAALGIARQVGFRARIASVTIAGQTIAFKLRAGLELRIGTATDLALKLEVARRILPLLGPGTTYLDVSLPARPVAMTGAAVTPNPQVAGGG